MVKFDSDKFMATVKEGSKKTFKSFLDSYVNVHKGVLRMSGEALFEYVHTHPTWKDSSKDKAVKMMGRIFLFMGKEADAEFLKNKHKEFMSEYTVRKALERREVNKLQPYIDKWRASNLKAQDKLILATVLFMLSPRSDFSTVVMGNSETQNCYDPETKKITYHQIVKQKDNKEYQNQVFDVPDEICLLIASLNRQNGEFIFRKQDNTKHRNKWFCTKIQRLCKRVFNENLGLNSLRKIVESNANVDATPKEILINAKKFGHTAQTSRTHYLGEVKQTADTEVETSLDVRFEELNKVFNMTTSTGNIQFEYKGGWKVTFEK
jgi:hypothetical protein